MKRWFFNTLTTASLFLLLATAFLLVRSFFVRDRLVWLDMPESDDGPIRRFSKRVESSNGGLLLQTRYEEWRHWTGLRSTGHSFHWSQPQITYPLYEPASIPGPDNRQFEFLGLEVVYPRPHDDWWDFQERTISVTIPLPGVMLVLLPGTLFGLRAWARGIRAARNRYCPSCGYDLRASPERCPECGAAAPKPSMSTQAP